MLLVKILKSTVLAIYEQVRTYKKQIEEAEEIATLNLAKFRKTQVNLQG